MPKFQPPTWNGLKFYNRSAKLKLPTVGEEENYGIFYSIVFNSGVGLGGRKGGRAEITFGA